MASRTQWIWVWVNPGSWLWTGRPGMLWFMGLWRVGNDWATELNWTLKLLILWIIIYCGKHVKRWECRTLVPVSWETCMQVKKQQLQPCIEQMTLSGLRQEYDEAVYWYLVCLTSKHRTTWGMPCWVSYMLESRLLAEISTTSYTRVTTALMVEKEEELNCLLMWVKEKSAIAGRKLNMIKTQTTASGPISSVSSLQSLSHVWIFATPRVAAPGLPVHHKLQRFTQTHAHRVGDAIQASHLSSLSPPAPNITPWQIEGESGKQWHILPSWALKSLQTVALAIELEKNIFLGRKSLWNLVMCQKAETPLHQQTFV